MKTFEGEDILVVDDVAANIRILGELLRTHYHIRVATDGEKALHIAFEKRPDLVLLDINMPGMDGYEVCRQLKEDGRTRDIPVIFISARDEVEDETRGLELGAVDYIIKPFSPSIVLARVRTHLALKRQRDDLKQMNEELMGLNHMKDNLLAVCSHDLRSPLNGILGFTDILLERDYLVPEDRESLDHIRSSGQVLLGLVNDILDLSKARSEQVTLKMDPISLVRVIKTSIGALKHLATAKQQAVFFEDQTEDAPVMGNASALGRVFNNLLSNAIKFTPNGGTIRLTMARDPKGGTRVQVCDDGIGISEEKIPLLFEPFTVTSKKGTSGEQGTGLGMSIVKEILEKQDIPIQVESHEGEGTCFTISFSASGAAPVEGVFSDTPKVREKAPVAKQKKLKILLAEDNPVNQKLAQKILEKTGHKVIIAENGREALNAYQKAPEEIDLILMDIQMPIMDGLEASRAIRSFEDGRSGGTDNTENAPNVRHVPIIALTGRTTEKDRKTCLKAGMDYLLTKPFNKEGLFAAIAGW